MGNSALVLDRNTLEIEVYTEEDSLPAFWLAPEVRAIQESRTGLGRPDMAVYHRGLLVGFVELKAPGKGADPERFADPHDKRQ